jgi:hypothetical protein
MSLPGLWLANLAACNGNTQAAMLPCRLLDVYIGLNMVLSLRLFMGEGLELRVLFFCCEKLRRIRKIDDGGTVRDVKG